MCQVWEKRDMYKTWVLSKRNPEPTREKRSDVRIVRYDRCYSRAI